MSTFLSLLSLSAFVATGLTAVHAQLTVNSPVPAVSSPCSCSSGHIPVSVDVTIPVDPSNPEGLHTTNTRRLQTTFQVFGNLCEPVSTRPYHDGGIQLLLHGSTYTNQYWDVRWNGLQNYSYMAYSCSKGISSFAYDNTGVGQTSRPTNATDCQMPTAASVASSLGRALKDGRVSRILTGKEKKYKKVVGLGHSQGSSVHNFVAITEGKHSPFDGLMLTGMIHDAQFIKQSPVVTEPARNVDPARWGNLDPGYVTTPNISARSLFYGPNNESFSSTVLGLDELTKDVSSKFISPQIKYTYAPALGYQGPVAEIVGSLDQTHCLDDGAPCNQAKLQVSEKIFWPDSKNFTVIVVDEVGHDLNLGFGAMELFPIMTRMFESFVH